METTQLEAQRRDGDFGKGSARSLRRDGRIPAVIYAEGGEATHVHIDPEVLVKAFRKSGNPNMIVQLDIEGEIVPCLVRETQRHPVNRRLLHVDFLRCSSGNKVLVPVRVERIGRAAGEALGGKIQLIRRTINVRCEYDNIPATIQADVSGLEVGDMIKASECIVPEGVELVFDHDFNIITLYGKRAAKAKKK